LTLIDTYTRECLAICPEKSIKKVHLDYSQPGRSTDNPHIESFNGSFRDECLNVSWFMSLEDAREKIERWRMDYNEYRPHSGPTHLTPAEFATAAGV
jgi:putative transposase